MSKLILTSAGFDNKRIASKFKELINMPMNKIRVLFIPTAAITKEQKLVIPLCKQELIDMDIKEENIDVYDFDRIIDDSEICNYNAIYVCGGDTQYLLDRFNENKLDLNIFLDNGGTYIGVSAGSIVLAQNLDNNLNYINCILNVHRKLGNKIGIIDTTSCPTIDITDNQAILINENNIEIIE
ncbi:Type 1 glutamine amidotransferase-like domain-containing protein [Vallitalea okinawensis]|uniref:Type 1 glutamine amidotransferase-like domain-containing protein n=1 Tax=Vallitalea okinawensis TaxID=2078660 RepID=UPI000CFC22FD|nr:Type 1 glutamine amidotransferase-like domain-containing protein [Vallitalea okinawensis]